jgi:hypothetical protein
VTPLMRMRSPDGDELSLFATVATFGTAVEVTTSELSIELTFPADAATAETMQNLACPVTLELSPSVTRAAARSPGGGG